MRYNCTAAHNQIFFSKSEITVLTKKFPQKGAFFLSAGIFYFGFILFKVSNTGLKDLQILLSVDVDCYAVVAALCVCHLTKDTAVR